MSSCTVDPNNLRKYRFLAQIIMNCRKCFRSKTLKKRVLLGKGCLSADYVIIGEAPSLHKEGPGKPFGAKSWPIYQALLKELGLTNEDVWVTNVVKCTLPWNAVGNRHYCRKFLTRELDIIKPKYIIVLGRKPADLLARPGIALTGSSWQGNGSTCFALPHPMSVHYGFALESYLKLVAGVATAIRRRSS